MGLIFQQLPQSQQWVTTLNIPTLVALLGVCIIIGKLIWGLSKEISELRGEISLTKIDINNKIAAVETKATDQSIKTDMQVKSLENDVHRLISLVELKITHRQENDAAMLVRLDKLDGNLTAIERSLWRKGQESINN